MWEDPIVAEVRRVREAYAAKHNYNLRVIYQSLKVQEECEKRQKVSFPPHFTNAAVRDANETYIPLQND